jgi:hypothetical protein
MPSLKVFPKLKLADMSPDNGSSSFFMKELTLGEILLAVFPSGGL